MNCLETFNDLCGCQVGNVSVWEKSLNGKAVSRHFRVQTVGSRHFFLLVLIYFYLLFFFSQLQVSVSDSVGEEED